MGSVFRPSLTSRAMPATRSKITRMAYSAVTQSASRCTPPSRSWPDASRRTFAARTAIAATPISLAGKGQEMSAVSARSISGR